MGQVCVDMGPPILNAPDVPTKLKAEGEVVKAPLEVDGKTWSVTCVSMGNPHCVTFGEHEGEVTPHLFYSIKTCVQKGFWCILRCQEDCCSV